MSGGSVLVRNASQVVTCEGDGPADLGIIDGGAVLLRGGKVWWIGPEAELPKALGDVEELDAIGR